MGYRQKLIKIVTFLGGLYFFLEFVLPEKTPFFSTYYEDVILGVMAIGVMAVGLGVVNLLAVHGSKLLFKKKGWIYSAALLFGLAAMSLIMIFDWKETSDNAAKVEKIYILRDFSNVILRDATASENEKNDIPSKEIRTSALIKAVINELKIIDQEFKLEKKINKKELNELKQFMSLIHNAVNQTAQNEAVFADGWYRDLAFNLGELATIYQDILNKEYATSDTKHFYRVLYDGLFLPLGSAMFSLLGFYVASAAYRAFRVKSTESALMILAALIVMLGQVPFGVILWKELPELRTWLLQVPSSAAFRAIEIGASVGALVMAFRMWLSIESESFKKEK